MHHKKVSIIIPVYQVENYLERAVDSALAQTLVATGTAALITAVRGRRRHN